MGKTNLLLRNLLRTPILELEAAKVNLGESRWLERLFGTGLVWLLEGTSPAPNSRARVHDRSCVKERLQSGCLNCLLTSLLPFTACCSK